METDAFGVSFDGGVDVESQSQRAAAIFTGDAGRGAGTDAFEEGLDFEAERLARFHGWLVDAEAGKSRSSGESSGGDSGGIGVRGAGDVDEEQVLTRVIDGDVLMRLEKAKLADLLRADAARCEIGDAA